MNYLERIARPYKSYNTEICLKMGSLFSFPAQEFGLRFPAKHMIYECQVMYADEGRRINTEK